MPRRAVAAQRTRAVPELSVPVAAPREDESATAVVCILMAHVLLFVSIIGLLGAINALRKPHTERPPRRRPPWLFAMLTAELVPLRISLRVALIALTGWAGVLDQRAGDFALVLTALTWALYIVVLGRSSRAFREVTEALTAVGFSLKSVTA